MIDRKSIRFLTFLLFLICSDLPDEIMLYMFILSGSRARKTGKKGE